MYSDNRWDSVTAGRVYPKGTGVRVGRSYGRQHTLVSNAVKASWRDKFDARVREAYKRTYALTSEPLVKPQAYRNLSR